MQWPPDFEAEDGDVVGTVLVFPVFVASAMLFVHLGVWYLARQASQAAAWDALRAAQLEGGNFEQAEQQGRATLGLSIAIDEGDSKVSITESDGELRVEVVADVKTIPVMSDTISVVVVGPKEELRFSNVSAP